MDTADESLYGRTLKYVTENFVSYCPTRTFSSGNSERLFLDAYGEDCLKGWHIEQGKDSSLRGLFDVGAEAYALLHVGVDPSDKSASKFHDLFSSFRKTVAELRSAFHDKISAGSIIAVRPDGRPAEEGSILEAEDVEVIKLGRTIVRTFHADDEMMKQFYVELLCVGCLREIDHAVVALVHNPIDAIESTLIAKEMLDLAKADGIEDEIKQAFVIRRARKAVAAKIAKDPRQDEKKFILECWRDWQSGQREYKGKAAFARDMIEKCEHLTSTKKVEDWCREWEKEYPPSQ